MPAYGDTGAGVNTTSEISDDLARKAKVHAARDGTTLRALVERGLHEVLRANRKPHRFELRDARVGGHGLQTEFQDADWQRIREAAYEGRGE